MAWNDPPLVTVAIPLYRSHRFVRRIVRNVRAISYPNVEILISDRHGEDDALEQLRQRLADDPRVRFLAARDRVDWIDHFNLLLHAGRGKYAMWMPHDDIFPPNYVGPLVRALQRRPGAILAFGCIEPIDIQGRPVVRQGLKPPHLIPGEPWTTRTALRLLTQWNPGVAFRGVFRRDLVVSRGLTIRRTHGTVLADSYWVFALALVGRLVYIPRCTCKKLYHEESAHAHWRFGARHALAALPILRSYVRDFAPPGPEAREAGRTLLVWTLLRLLRTDLLEFPMLGGIRGRIRRRVRKSLRRRVASRGTDRPGASSPGVV